MNQLIEEIELCKFAELPKDFRSEYKKTSNKRCATPQFMDKLSTSTVVVKQNNYINLSDFNFGILKEQDNTFQIHIETKLPMLEKMLCQYLFNGNHNAFNKLVEDEINNLMNIQKLLYSKFKNCVFPIDEMDYIQPLVTVMEADFIERIQRDSAYSGVINVTLQAAQGFPLETQVTVTTTAIKKKQKTIKIQGTSDILIQDIRKNNAVVRLQELKPSCCSQNGLYKCSAESYKSQLCGQLYCLGNMYPDLNGIVGGLLDLFVISIAIRLNTTTGITVGDQTTTTTRYYISERVEDPRSYVILLMFNLFGLPLNNMEQLTADCETPQEPVFPPVEYKEGTLTDDDADVRTDTTDSTGDVRTDCTEIVDSTNCSVNNTIKEELSNPKSKRRKQSVECNGGTKEDMRFSSGVGGDKVAKVGRQRQTRPTSSTLCTQLQRSTTGKENKQQQQRQHQPNIMHTDSLSEHHQEQVRELLEWDNRRLGLASLTVNELSKRNAAAPFKPNLMF